jgi:molybdopterin biosynthesis enzyme
MDGNFTSPQRITRLTPLADVLAAIERIKPVAPREAAITGAFGRTIAADVTAARPFPASAVALRDGFAVRADTITDASAYAPIPLAQMPLRIDAGEATPSGTDAVAPLDTLVMSGGMAQAVAPATPGDGILPAGADASAASPIVRAGQVLRASDIAALTACNVALVTIREPRVGVMLASQNDKAKTTRALIADMTARAGCHVAREAAFERAIQQRDCDAMIAIGGTGSGRDDRTVETLVRSGKLIAHGIGVMPGDTSAFGFIEERPVLLLPGRIDAALAAWLAVGRPLLARLCGQTRAAPAFTAVLSRKVTSTIGITDIVLVRQNGDTIEPLASGYWPMQAIAQADGYIVVPAQSEGHSEGANVAVRPLP